MHSDVRLPLYGCRVITPLDTHHRERCATALLLQEILWRDKGAAKKREGFHFHTPAGLCMAGGKN